MAKYYKHKVKKHHWENGFLKTVETFFDTVEEALEHATSSDAHVVKVYNTDGEVVHTEIGSIVPEQLSTYA
jgi:methylmalonyl-CoA mutase cobalamin-binding subunit